MDKWYYELKRGQLALVVFKINPFESEVLTGNDLGVREEDILQVAKRLNISESEVAEALEKLAADTTTLIIDVEAFKKVWDL